MTQGWVYDDNIIFFSVNYIFYSAKQTLVNEVACFK